MHEGHRQRVKKKFIEQGADSFEKHELLELLLFYGVARKNTNDLAHKLIDEFGSLHQILDVPINRLTSVDGVGESTAILIRIVSKLCRIYIEESLKTPKRNLNKRQVEEIIFNKFIGRIKEHTVLALFDAKRNLVFCDVISQGSLTFTDFHIRDIVELALKYNATKVIIAHNHPSEIALPSNDDIKSTIALKKALSLLDIKLIDHLIVTKNDYVSLADSELGNQIF